MKSLLVQGPQLTAQSNQYLQDSLALVSASAANCKSSENFKELYKVCLAAQTVLKGLSDKKLRPSMSALITICLRIPLLVALGQAGLVRIELRRFLEVVLWIIYFSDHPIEWLTFAGERGSGFTKDARQPIAFAAYRDLNSFFEYAFELFQSEPSGLATKALRGLGDDKKTLHTATHAGEIAKNPAANVPVETYSAKDLAKLTALVRRIFSHSVIILSAYHSKKFDTFTASSRTYFDWLAGSANQKAVRKGQFGLPIH